MKLINTQKAVGHVICHDITQIIPGVTKDARFRKGHVVTEEDIPVLLSLGKEHLYVWEKTEKMLHEDEGAEHLRKICQNKNMHPTAVKEGKIELIADIDGLFQVDTKRLTDVNMQGEIMIATRHTNTAVKAGDKLAGTRIIPLVIAAEKLEAVEKAAGNEPLLKLFPWKLKTAGVITTGREVFKGRIQDKFTPVIINKLESYGITVTTHTIVGDELENIKAAITAAKTQGVDMILCTGGMSVDPDDITPGAIKATGANIVTYGAPVLPGAMFLLGYFDDGTPVMGLPGCIMYAKATIFDLVLPRIVAGVPVTRYEIAAMGHGGLCFSCEKCYYPICPFGKGV